MRKKIKNKNTKTRFFTKSKKGQLFGMPFNMLFSILLIIFFLVAGFIAIRFFLGFQKQSQLGLFIKDLQDSLDDSWNSPSASFDFKQTLPSGIEYVCFINMTDESFNANPIEEQVYDYVQFSGASYNINFVYWPVEKAGELAYTNLKHIKLPEGNPYCIAVENNLATIKISKDFGEALPSVR